MKFKGLIFILIFSFTIVFAQDATLKGHVSETNGEPAIQANVIIDASKGWAAATDFDGNYSISVPAGTYYVLYRYIGKEDKIIETTLTAGETKVQNVALDEKVELINTVVVSASKYEKKLSEETVSMEVLKGDLIESTNVVDVSDGLNKVPGVTITEGQANIRGGAGWSYGAGSRVTVLYDGLPLLTADAADAKWSFIPVENIEQVEVIKGAASSIYGSGALNGVINVRTGYAKSVPETKVNVWSGVIAGPRDKSEGWWYNTGNNQPFFTGANFVHKRKIKRVDLVINGQYTSKADDLQENSGGDGRIGMKFRYRPKSVEGLSMGINVNAYRSWGSAFFLWNGDGDQSRLPMPNTASAYQNNRITVDPFISYFDKKQNNYSFKFRYFNAKNTNQTGQGSIPVTYYSELQYNRYFEKAKLNVVGGLAGFFSTTRSPTGNAEESLIGEHNGANIAPYVQVDKKLFNEKLNLTVGARYEYFTVKSLTYDTTRTSDLKRPLFRFGANYRVAEATYLRASWGEGYRFPSQAELFVNSDIGGIGLFPNPRLEPETGWYAELGIKQGFKAGNWGAYFDAAFFVNRYNDMMEFNFGQFGVFDLPSVLAGGSLNVEDLGIGFSSQNVGETRIMGLDIGFGSQGKIGNMPLNILAGYTYVLPKSLNWEEEQILYNELGEIVTPGTSIVESVVGLSTINGTEPTYAGSSSSSDNVMKYRNKHTFVLDVSTSYKKVDFGVSVQYRSWMENVDYFFVSEFLAGEIPTSVLSGPLGNLFEIENPVAADFNDPRDPDPTTPQYNTVEELVGTGAFTGLKRYRDKYNGRGTTLVDARIAYRFNENAKLSLVGKNLLNLTYDIRPTLLGDPMSFALQFSYSFKGKKSE